MARVGPIICLANGGSIRSICGRKHFHCAPVAQLDRVAGSDPVGRGFESLQARHFLAGFAGCGAGSRSE